VQSDGDDRIFGDLGNDWLVGGTGRDTVYGGWGGDLMNVDDNLDTNGGVNDLPDTHTSYEDRAFGGAGVDVLIGNTGGDRLIDWVGEFNSYLVPFAPFGLGTVSRQLAPGLAEFLYALSQSDGADQTLGGDAARNSEPYAELGLIRQQDFEWQDQTGGPIDPQPGNVPGGSRDVLRSATFSTNTFEGFAVDSGTWNATGNKLEVSAESLHGDAAAIWNIPEYLPVYYEVLASISVIKPLAGWNANAYIIFDYQDPTHFKFAGIDVSTNKLVMGHRTESGWVVDEQTPFQAKPDEFHNMLLAVNGLTATLIVNNASVFSHTYAPRVVDGHSYGLNYGYVGFGSDNSRGAYDNIAVRVLPPQITLDETETFDDGTADRFTGTQSGSWTVTSGRYDGTPSGGGVAFDTIDYELGRGIETNAYLELDTTVRSSATAGVIFDAYSSTDYKFAVVDLVAQRILIGHVDGAGTWVVDASVSRSLAAGVDHVLLVILKGSTVSLTVDGQIGTSLAYNAAVTDGAFGTFAKGGTASYDRFRVRTSDSAFEGTQPAVPSVSISDATRAEGASGSSTVTVQLTLSAAAQTVTSVGWSTAAGSATPGVEYVASSGTATFAAGTTSATIAISIQGDTLFEPDETFTILLSSPSGLTIADGTGVVTIQNDDAPPMPSVSIQPTASVTEGNNGTRTVTLTMTLSAASTSAVTVAYATANGTATAGSDYVAKSGTVTFGVGVTSQSITVTVNGDRTVEPNETFTVTLSAPANATLGNAVASVTIVTDDGTPLLAAEAAPAGGDMAELSLSELEATVARAAAEWIRVRPRADFTGVSVAVGDLEGALLGVAAERSITLDSTAAGWGWRTAAGSRAGSIDLLTVVLHELGHLLGLDHESDELGGVMAATVSVPSKPGHRAPGLHAPVSACGALCVDASRARVRGRLPAQTIRALRPTRIGAGPAKAAIRWSAPARLWRVPSRWRTLPR
jgi:hypothetical protein